MSTFSKTLALLFGMLVFGVQVSTIRTPSLGTRHHEKANWK